MSLSGLFRSFEMLFMTLPVRTRTCAREAAWALLAQIMTRVDSDLATTFLSYAPRGGNARVVVFYKSHSQDKSKVPTPMLSDEHTKKVCSGHPLVIFEGEMEAQHLVSSTDVDAYVQTT